MRCMKKLNDKVIKKRKKIQQKNKKRKKRWKLYRTAKAQFQCKYL